MTAEGSIPSVSISLCKTECSISPLDTQYPALPRITPRCLVPTKVGPHVSRLPISPADLCHPTIARAPFTREGWIFELKHDGFRAFARTGAAPELRSRWGRSMAAAFPEILDALARLREGVFDAELLVPDRDGRSDFEELRRRSLLQRPRAIAEAASRTPAVLVVFDVLHAGERDMRALPLSNRRQWLLEHVHPSAGVQIVQHVPTHGEALFREIARHDQEGIVAKRLDAPYRAGRQLTWLKIKNRDYSRRAAVEWQSHALAGA